MNTPIYNVDRHNAFNQLVTVNVTSFSYPIYYQSYEEDVGLSYTVPEFLGRLRRVKHDGSIIAHHTIDKIDVPRGGKLYIAPDGSFYFSLKASKDPTKKDIIFQFKLKNSVSESYYPCEIPEEFYGKFGSSILLSEENLEHFLNSYKIPVIPRKIKGINNMAIILDDASYADVCDELDYEEITF